MSLIEESYQRLYPEKEIPFTHSIHYSGKFSDYNANVKYTRTTMEFHLSKAWKDVSHEIQIGLIQSLMLKAMREKRKTLNIDMYNLFIKNVHISIPKSAQDSLLLASFERVNQTYFDGILEQPNLRWGSQSARTLGHYRYGTDTITMSTILRDAPPKLLDYVMYHEMLHKKLKFNCNTTRNHYHTAEFRQLERQFANQTEVEKQLSVLASREHRKNKRMRTTSRRSFWNWFQ